MSEKLEVLAKEAFKLAPEEREELVDRLLTGLDPPVDEVSLAWAKLAQHRFDLIKQGEIETFDAELALQDARQRLKLARERLRGK